MEFPQFNPFDNDEFVSLVLYNVTKEADFMEEYTAERMMEIVKNEMSNAEREKFLLMMFNEYYNATGKPVDLKALDY